MLLPLVLVRFARDRQRYLTTGTLMRQTRPGRTATLSLYAHDVRSPGRRGAPVGSRAPSGPARPRTLPAGSARPHAAGAPPAPARMPLPLKVNAAGYEV